MFQFKQFTIHQDNTPMKVGTDGVLLGAWANLEHADRILDIGTGTGLIALMAAQRNTRAHIDALEIVPAACEQAKENIAASPWRERIEVIPQALQVFRPSMAYDCILCNPPFFIDSTPTPDQGRTLARHSQSLPHPELAEHACRLLTAQGTFHVILPVIEARQLIAYAQTIGLYPQKITKVLPTPDKPPKRLLITFIKQQNPILETELILELSRHHYSKEYIALTREFYLHLA